jgi:hypothetical protein
MRKMVKFQGVDINDVRELQKHFQKPTDTHSESDDTFNSENESVDSLKNFKPPSAIQIGKLEDQEISKQKEIYKKETSVTKRDESEPYDNFLK